MLAAWSRRRGNDKVRPAGDLGRLAALVNADSEAVRIVRPGWPAYGTWSRCGRCCWTWPGTRKRPRQSAKQPSTDLAHWAASPAGKRLRVLADAGQPLETRRLAVVALTGLDLGEAAKRAVKLLAEEQTANEACRCSRPFVQRKNGAAVLAAALGTRKLPADVAQVGIRTVRESGRDAPALVEALTKAGSLTFGPRTLTADEMRRMVADVARLGDPARGELLYRRQDLSCTKCHAIAGSGGQVGPDLASIGTSAPVDYLVESLLLPNKAIKEGYHALTVTTGQGRIFTGIKVSESNTELVLRTAEDSEISIPVNNIEGRIEGGSLMPDGLTDTLTRAELLDLVRFLSELGKVGPYSVSKASLVRRWQALAAKPAANVLLRRFGQGAVTSDDPALTWLPVYSLVSGTLPLDAVPHLEVTTLPDKGVRSEGIVRCQLDVTTGGKVKLRLNSAKDLTLWVDRAAVPLEVKDEMVLDLPAGNHTLTFGLDMKARRQGLRCELDDEPGSAAQARIVGGK